MLLETETIHLEPDITVVKFTGKITLGRESQRIEVQIDELLKQNRRKIIFDLTAVTYIDSAGLGVITLCFGKLTEAGGAFCLAGAQGLAQRLLHMTKLDSMIPNHGSLEAAVQALGN